MVVRSEERHARSVATLSVIREELLAQTMTASEVLQRRISESIHDGPLQDVLAARQELIELRAAAPHDQRVSTALAGLQSASDLLRQATFELHPAVLEQVGLGAAVEQLASFHAQRSGIRITDDVDYPIRDEIDPIVFGVARELLSNVVQHSRARNASVALGISDGVCVLDVADDGVGVSGETMARRLTSGPCRRRRWIAGLPQYADRHPRLCTRSAEGLNGARAHRPIRRWRPRGRPDSRKPLPDQLFHPPRRMPARSLPP